jgi:hypothetical protein
MAGIWGRNELLRMGKARVGAKEERGPAVVANHSLRRRGAGGGVGCMGVGAVVANHSLRRRGAGGGVYWPGPAGGRLEKSSYGFGQRGRRLGNCEHFASLVGGDWLLR